MCGLECTIVKDCLFVKADEARIIIVPPLEHVYEYEEEDVVHIYQTLFEDYPDREGTVRKSSINLKDEG